MKLNGWQEVLNWQKQRIETMTCVYIYNSTFVLAFCKQEYNHQEAIALKGVAENWLTYSNGTLKCSTRGIWFWWILFWSIHGADKLQGLWRQCKTILSRNASVLPAKIIGIIGRLKQRAKYWHNRSKFE